MGGFCLRFWIWPILCPVLIRVTFTYDMFVWILFSHRVRFGTQRNGSLRCRFSTGLLETPGNDNSQHYRWAWYPPMVRRLVLRRITVSSRPPSFPYDSSTQFKGDTCISHILLQGMECVLPRS